MRYFLVLAFIVSFFSANSQDKVFRSNDQKITVVKGDVVKIMADTAYIVSSERAKLLNEKLDELTRAQELNEHLDESNKELLSKLKEVQQLVSKLINRMEEDGTVMNADLDEVLNQLDDNLETLQQNNKELQQTNQDLQGQISSLNGTIKKLRKEIRGVWWNGIADKIVAGGLGLGAGLLIGLL